MDILSESFIALRRNAAAVALYVFGISGLNAAAVAVRVLTEDWFKQEAHAQFAHTYTVLSSVFLVIVVSLAQVVTFAKLGADIDRPLWRVSGVREAITRFFRIWLILNLLIMATVSLPELIADGPAGDGLKELILLLYVTLVVVCVPMGACVMFRGPETLEEASRCFSPLLHELPRTLLLFLLGALTIVMELSYYGIRESMPSKWTAVSLSLLLFAVSSFIECFVFAGTWLICMTHREHGEDTDFDF
ncbi:MAG: hypothetical protein HZB26_25535 [Candidatus Hydrogenedentes bacterium]|nr:hypothetical protein [Candidatus Hydrogenedentota bacterium]